MENNPQNTLNQQGALTIIELEERIKADTMELNRLKQQEDEGVIKKIYELAENRGWFVVKLENGLKIAFKKPRRGRPAKKDK